MANLSSWQAVGSEAAENTEALVPASGLLHNRFCSSPFRKDEDSFCSWTSLFLRLMTSPAIIWINSRIFGFTIPRLMLVLVVKWWKLLLTFYNCPKQLLLPHCCVDLAPSFCIQCYLHLQYSFMVFCRRQSNTMLSRVTNVCFLCINIIEIWKKSSKQASSHHSSKWIIKQNIIAAFCCKLNNLNSISG